MNRSDIIRQRYNNIDLNTNIFCISNIYIHQNDKYNYKLWILGVSQYGHSVSVEITDYFPSFLMVCPDHISSFEDLDILRDEISESLYNEQGIRDMRILYMTKLVGFEGNDKVRMVHIECESISKFKQIVLICKKKGFHVYHDDIPHSLQFFHNSKLAYFDWVQIKDHVRPKQQINKKTSCNYEYACSYKDLNRLDISNTPPLLKMFLRLKCISRDGVMEKNPHYHPDSNRPFDRILCIGIGMSWCDDSKSDFCFQRVLTILPCQKSSDKNLIHYCKTEKELLLQFQEILKIFDPDDIFCFTDYYDPFKYIFNRMNRYNLPLTAVEKFIDLKPYVKKNKAEEISFYKLNTRTVFNIESALQKKVFLSIECYDLYTISMHKSIRKEPETLEHLIIDNTLPNKCLIDAPWKIVEFVVQDIDLLRKIDRDIYMRIEFSNISRVSFTETSDTICRGEQIRCWHKIIHECLYADVFINKEKLSSKELRFATNNRPPTYIEPEELSINIQFREKCKRELREKLEKYNKTVQSNSKSTTHQNGNINKFFIQKKASSLSDSDNEEEEENDFIGSIEKSLDGGSVLKSSPAFYKDDIITVLDLMSLYPSIIIGAFISYENVVYDSKYLDLPDFSYKTFAINRYETIVVAQRPGIIPQLLIKLLKERQNVKNKMKLEKDPFRKTAYDMEQNSLKIMCNATFGFMGAKKGFLPNRSLMFVVTGIGRYIQKISTDLVGRKYGLNVVYGDTDSIFVKLDYGMKNEKIELICEYANKKYEMDDYFKQLYNKSNVSSEDLSFSWNNVVKHYSNRKRDPLDITTFSHIHQIYAIFYLVSDKLSQEITASYPINLIMEFEAIATKCLMYDVKKCYAYLFMDEDNPSVIAKTKLTGTEAKKRDWCLWTRDILKGIFTRIHCDRESELEQFIEGELNKLVNHQIPIFKLKISKGYKDETKYKSDNLITLQLVKKIEQRTRMTVKPNSRLYFVIVEGDEKQFMRAEVPEYVEEHNLKLDYLYYLEKQFYKPVKKTLKFHSDLFDFDKMYNKFKQILMNQKNNVCNIMEKSDKKILRLEDILSNKRKNESKLPPTKKTKTNYDFKNFFKK
jgi:DNA polymerase elongation subunit (family B)